MKPSIRNALGISLTVQGIGSLAPFFTIVALARIAGPDVQGVFSTFKTWIDLVSALFVFGFPQAFVYLINKNLAKRDEMLNVSLLYTILATMLIFPISILSVTYHYNTLPDNENIYIFSLFLSFGLGAVVIHRLVRAIYLTIDDGVWFSLITSAPSAFLLVTIVIVAIEGNFRYDIAFFVSGILTILSTLVWIKRIIDITPNYKFHIPKIPTADFVSHSTHSFLQSVIFTIQPVLTIFLLKRYGSTIETIAYFTASTMVIASANVVFSIISPILFNRWTAAADRAFLIKIRRYALLGGICFLIGGILAIPLYSFFVPLVLGSEYVFAVWAFQIISLAMAPVAFTRIIYPAIHAAGGVRENTLSCVVRLAVSGLVQWVLSAQDLASPLEAALFGWIVAEWFAAAFSWQATRGRVIGRGHGDDDCPVRA